MMAIVRFSGLISYDGITRINKRGVSLNVCECWKGRGHHIQLSGKGDFFELVGPTQFYPSRNVCNWAPFYRQQQGIG